jgi:hypothetical protein
VHAELASGELIVREQPSPRVWPTADVVRTVFPC